MLLESAGRIGRKKGSRPFFKDFYAEWADALGSTLLPLLRHSISAASDDDRGCPLLGGAAASPVSSSDLLAARVCAVHAHFQSYFQALDLAARHDVSQLLSPTPWRAPLERPFLWLGDFHPALLTNLLRSFLRRPPSRENSSRDDLLSRTEQIARGLRQTVPTLVARLRDAQAGFLETAVAEWAMSKREAVETPATSDGATEARLGELASVFLDANRLRKSVLAEIMGAMDVHQAALYLEALAGFVLGLRDPHALRDFERSRMRLSTAPGSP